MLWAPWRLSYVTAPAREAGCIFCRLPALPDPQSLRAALVLFADERAAVMLNRFPYAHAHLMVVPRVHVGDLASLDDATALALHRQMTCAMKALGAEYGPQGFNVGLNVGRAGGAGIAGHLHWHVVPRWEGDTNFMPVLADTRVMSEHIDVTYERLAPHFAETPQGLEGRRWV